MGILKDFKMYYISLVFWEDLYYFISNEYLSVFVEEKLCFQFFIYPLELSEYILYRRSSASFATADVHNATEREN